MKKRLFLAFIAVCISLSMAFARDKSSKKSADVDLTRMSSTMIYAKVFDMLINPQNYEGKKIRMHGIFDVFEYEEAGVKHRSFACARK